MKYSYSLVVCLLCLFLAGCNSQNSGVKVQTAGIFTPVLLSLEGQDADGKDLDLGELLITNGPRLLSVQVYNGTKFPYTELDLAITAKGVDAVPSTTYNPTDTGEMAFPGLDGTCGRTLAAGATCEIRLLFAPRESRTYNEILTLNFKNYVDAESHIVNFTIIAGTPASLSFTNDITQYTFGQIVGQAHTPVVERSEGATFEQELEVVNSGGLPAKNLVLTLVEECVSALTSACPAGMNGAYSITHDCPTNLFSGEKCKARIAFKGKNTDPEVGVISNDAKEINYRATVKYAYTRDMTGATSALNGYFRSVSTNIEARFKTSISVVGFDVPIVAGNRDTRSIRINNFGYREGEIRSLTVRDAGGAHMATCKAQNSSSILDCRSAANTPLDLAIFPFTIKDRNNCLSLPPTPPAFIDVGSGCLFDFIFQPSVTYDVDKNTEFLNLQVQVTYDSRLKGQTTLVTSTLFTLSAKSLAAAKIVLEKINYDSITYPFTGTGPWVSDLGRITLQSPNFYKRKGMVITFKNIGSVAATNISISDASNVVIPIGGTGANLGTTNPKYYASTLASDSTCTVIGPGNSCSISSSFAPIGMDTNQQENGNMFDSTDSAGIPYKGFQVHYASGALYTDLNRVDDTNYPAQTSEARLRAVMIRKGALMQLEDDARNVSAVGSNFATAGDSVITHIYLQNIGTGPVSYIRYLNPPSAAAANPTKNLNVTLLPTPDPASLGADHDCLSYVDYDLTYTVPQDANPSTRAGHFQPMFKEESCVYTIKMQTNNVSKFPNSTSCNSTLPTTTNIEEGSRFFNRDLEAAGGMGLWEYCRTSTNISLNNMKFTYFDGDPTNPALPPTATYGMQYNLNNYNYTSYQFWSGKISPYNPIPWLTATIYRPEFTLPKINDGYSYHNMITFPEGWFYGLVADFFSIRNDPLQPSPFLQGDESRDFVPTLNGFANRSTYDYIIYLGSFPQGSPAVDFPIGLRNFGNAPTIVKTLNASSDASFTILAPTVVLPLTVTANADVTPLNYRLSTATPGEHQMVLTYTYESGRHTQDIIYKSSTTPSNSAATKEILTQRILILANIIPTGSFPFIGLAVQDYDVVQNDGAPPTVSLAPTPYNVSLTWNTTTTAQFLNFDTIKITGVATANDVYAKKLLKFTNNSAVSLSDFKVLYRANATASTTITTSNNFKTVGAGTTCTSGMTLAPGDNCLLTLFYQPGTSDTSSNFTMSMMYKMGAGQYVIQNAGISLFPRSPGNLAVQSKSTESINYKVTTASTSTTKSSYPLNFGTVNLDTIPKILAFDQNSGTFIRTSIINSQATKTSLLLSYQKYLAANSLRGYTPSIPAPTSVEPLAAEYRTVSSIQYARMHLIKYANGSDRIVVEGSKGCFYGDDETNNAIPSFQKGFNNTSTTPCYLLVTLNANFEYLFKNIAINNGDDMRDNAFELWYFSVFRSSTASLWLHVKGTVNPDPSVSTGTYASVNAFENKTVNFTLPQFTANNSALGSIVGMRVLYSATSTTLASPYTTGLGYVDVRPYTGPAQLASFTTGLANGNYYYFRAVAIRYDARYNQPTSGVNARFIGLNTGEYLSAGTNNATPLTLVVPPLNMYYFHTQKLLIDKNLFAGVTYDPYTTASNRCTSRSALALKNPSTLNRSYTMIDRAAWNILVMTPAATNYSNIDKTAHWIIDPKVSIDTMCAGKPGFTAGQQSQVLESSSIFYLRNSAAPSTTVNQAVGGIPGTNYSYFNSYVDGGTGFASARCMVTLP